MISYKVDSLFAGIGGVCSAFKNAGCDVIWANEFDPHACMTYRLNNKSTYLEEGDIKEVPTSKIPCADIIVAGFPCQPFSLAGHRRGLEDERGKLFTEITRIATEMEKKPRVIFLENVSNLYSHDHGKTYAFVKQALMDAGYNYVTEKIMNTKDYSKIPQFRSRIYVVAFREKEDYDNFKFPEPEKNKLSVNDLINRSIKQPEKYYYSTHNAKHFDDFDREVTDRNAIYQYRRVYVRKNKTGVCPTLTACMGVGGHNVPIIRDDYGVRKLTPEECLLFQGFDPSFEFPEMGDCHKYKQIGNSVTIPVVEAIAKCIVKALSQTDCS